MKMISQNLIALLAPESLNGRWVMMFHWSGLL